MKNFFTSLPIAAYLLIINISLISCKDHDLAGSKNYIVNGIPIVMPLVTTDTILYASVNGDVVPVYLTIPPNCDNEALPAVVVLHGSGGMWNDDDISSGVMSRQNREWKEIFDDNCIIGAFVDSYTLRGCIERIGDWKDPPKAFLISSQFVRPYDAYAGLDILRHLTNPDGSFLVRHGDEGVLGFSDGGTALTATLYDTDATPKAWKWTEKREREYSVSLPAERPIEGGFASGVFYYGGSAAHSYWGGNPCSNSSDFIYTNYAPILYHIPTEDDLTENTLCAFNKLKEKGADVTKYVYNNTEHGFDASRGSEEAESDLARKRTIAWFKKYLHI